MVCFIFAGESGKIAGRISDESNSPLIGVNVIIDGTSLGAATDSNGDYFIINIKPGIYSVRISMIGYQKLEIKDVLVRSDLTSRINASLTQTVIESEEAIEVIASRPMIQRDATSSIQVLSSDEIINMPVENVQDILATQAGFTKDADGDLHVRGGRSKELVYMIDGFVVKDPMGGDFIGNVNQNAIQELTIISGTFNAEYGQAMSGAINIITRDGDDTFSGRLDYSTNDFIQSPYHEQDAFKAVRDSDYVWIDISNKLVNYYQNYINTFSTKPVLPIFDLTINGQISTSAGGPLFFPNTTFYSSIMAENQDSNLPHGGDVTQDIMFKLTNRITDKTKISLQFHSSQKLNQYYSHKWKYLPLNNVHHFKAIERYAFSLNQSLRQNLFYTTQIALQKTWSRTGVRDLLPLPSQYDPPKTGSIVYFYETGTYGTYSLNQTTVLQFKSDLTWQANQRHLIKSGIQYYNYTLDIHNEEDPWVDGVNFYEDTTFTPIEAAFYVQDKVEFDFLVINLGLRWDYLDPNAGMWENVERFAERDPLTGNIILAKSVDVDPATQFSPRIGIGYPVTDKTIFHFSYGHFFQTASFDALYTNAMKDLSASLPMVGNPRILPQKTISFETGIKHEISPNLALHLNIWSKDIRGLLSTQQMRYLSTEYILFANTDYASVKGFDISVDKRITTFLGGSIKYTYSIAKGNNSNPKAGYFSAYFKEEVPHQEFFLDFDQRHDIAINLIVRGPESSHIHGNIICNVGSGLPYTPYVDPAFRVDVNSARKPWTFSIDARLNKKITVSSFSLDTFIEVTNFTNYENIRYVYSRTGKPFDPGASLLGNTPDSNYNPAHIGPPRAIKIGAFVEW
ncbi:MAG: TonB-dependent receptor [Candidatus Marinimicrobia bacterium]|nr:TonB-dependent receptor [Candidatus Neomarinimicrobiota bacterium]